MIGKHIYVKNWISYSQIKDYKECPFDDYHEDALIKELIEKNYIICGDTHQCSEYNTIPVFNDGYLMLSMRRWQEIMTEAYRIKSNNLDTPNFYMASLCNIEEVLP